METGNTEAIVVPGISQIHATSHGAGRRRPSLVRQQAEDISDEKSEYQYLLFIHCKGICRLHYV